MAEYKAGDTVVMKKGHPCGTNRWQIIRIGMDVKIRCEGCGRVVVQQRKKFDRNVKGKA